ncbi:MAG: enoyl-CoA hydratase/isomerase family protein [Actinomycetes bacterium]
MTRIARIEISGTGPNLLDPDVMGALERSILDADADPEITGILLTGAGGSFCGGLDVAAIRAGADPVAFASALVSLLRIFPTLSTPIAAAVNGDAVASGASIVAVCDYAVSTPTARLGTFEVSVGVWPMIAQVPIVHRIGTRFAMENIGTGEPFTADRAREVGLVNAVREPADVEPSVVAWLEAASRGGAAVAAGRRAFYELAELGYDDALRSSLERFAAMFRDKA